MLLQEIIVSFLPSFPLVLPCSPIHQTLPPNCGPDLGQEGHLSASFWLCWMATSENSLKFSLQRASEVFWTPVTEDRRSPFSWPCIHQHRCAQTPSLLECTLYLVMCFLVIVKINEALCLKVRSMRRDSVPLRRKCSLACILPFMSRRHDNHRRM